MRLQVPVVISLVFLAAVSPQVLASGERSGTGLLQQRQSLERFGGKPSRSVPALSIDSDKYALGSRVYSRQITGPVNTRVAKPQLTRLQALEVRLPKQQIRKANLELLAGRLTDVELDALEYFLKIRYRI